MVTVRRPTSREYVNDGDDTLLVGPENRQAMANAISTILHEGDLRERMSANARTTAERYYWNLIHDRMNRFITSVLDRER
jgi:glycosyltransferase involved in cell wall biosynthesis